jgi:hypothetical protein
MLFGLVCQNVLADCGIFWTIASFVKISSGHSDFLKIVGSSISDLRKFYAMFTRLRHRASGYWRKLFQSLAETLFV